MLLRAHFAADAGVRFLMKCLILITALLFLRIAHADLFAVNTVELCSLFVDEGIVPTEYGPGSNPNGKLCYTPVDHEEWKNTGYLISYRVIGHWKWTELTSNAYISFEGLESRIVEDDVLSKYKRMVYLLLKRAARNTGEDKLSEITDAIVSENQTSQSIEAISIRSYISRKIHAGQERVEYRVNIHNQCMYHPSGPCG